MSGTDGLRFVPALRRTWEAIRGKAHHELGKRVISGTELRAYLRESLATRDEPNRSVRAWNAMEPGVRDAVLRVAFPDDSYALAPPADGGRN
jgi:hypothetical protein